MSEFVSDRSFPSSAACLHYLIGRYDPGGSDEIWLERPDSHIGVPHRSPRVLFRGECGLFPESKPAAGRLDTWKTHDGARLSPEARLMFLRMSEWLRRRFTAADYHVSDLEALAILQHYHIPTVVIDVTSDPGVAMTFAVGSGDKQYGRIAVMPAGISRHGVLVADLRDHGWAVRAHRQHGFGVARSAPPMLDLKSQWARTHLGVSWYEFPITAHDRGLCQRRHEGLVSLKTDPTAGLLRYHVIEFVEKIGKLPHDLAYWIVHRVPMVPRVYRALDVTTPEYLVDHVAPGEVDFDEEVEREYTLRYLSRDYRDDSRERVRDWVRLEAGDIVADPRTLHQPISHPRTSAA